MIFGAKGLMLIVEYFPCCWVSPKKRAVAFSLRKTPMKVVLLDYPYRKMLKRR